MAIGSQRQVQVIGQPTEDRWRRPRPRGGAVTPAQRVPVSALATTTDGLPYLAAARLLRNRYGIGGSPVVAPWSDAPQAALPGQVLARRDRRLLAAARHCRRCRVISSRCDLDISI